MVTRPAPSGIAPVIAATDLARARAFYEDQLGLDGSAAPGGGWVLADDRGTVLNLPRERGVPFLGPDDSPFDLDDDLVSVGQDGLEVAWMRDPDGSVLTVFSS